MQISISKVHPDAKIPTHATLGAAGFDFYAIDAGQISYGSPVIFGTGVAMAIPENYVLLLFSRSGHGFKENIRLSNCTGVIDSDYTGEIKVKLTMDFPSWQSSFTVDKGDRIAQGVILPIPKIWFNLVDTLPQTLRGDAGLGSTGVR
jgi:dUTP pyrophosphatase